MKTVYLTGVNGSLELKTYTACYGILGLQNFLQPSCPGGQKIAVRAVYSMAKYKSSGCPQEQTPANNSAAAVCLTKTIVRIYTTPVRIVLTIKSVMGKRHVWYRFRGYRRQLAAIDLCTLNERITWKWIIIVYQVAVILITFLAEHFIEMEYSCLSCISLHF